VRLCRVYVCECVCECLRDVCLSLCVLVSVVCVCCVSLTCDFYTTVDILTMSAMKAACLASR
jgi:hypothetical protein